jgi:hypothetical protein
MARQASLFGVAAVTSDLWSAARAAPRPAQLTSDRSSVLAFLPEEDHVRRVGDLLGVADGALTTRQAAGAAASPTRHPETGPVRIEFDQNHARPRAEPAVTKRHLYRGSPRITSGSAGGISARMLLAQASAPPRAVRASSRSNRPRHHRRFARVGERDRATVTKRPSV